METALRTVNALISALFFICYAYQFLYIPLVLAKKQRPLPCPPSPHRYAVLIAARNEAAVIGGLLDSLRQQTYDPALLTVFVVADNCTDGTADIARRRGAVVYERFNHINVGKGYALDFLTQHIKADYPDGFDGYFVFDADNVLSPDYIERMNAVFSGGYEIVTSYRNSKNYADNWISAGYALWFLRESRYLNHARSLLGTSCAVSGTGFLFSRAVLEETGPWPFHLLTEDIEFSIACATRGRRIGYCGKAVIYDEQPEKFKQSWDQRLRWSKGFYQVDAKYTGSLLRGCTRGGRDGMSCYDMLMTVAPCNLFTIAVLALSIIVCAVSLTQPAFITYRAMRVLGRIFWLTLRGITASLFLFGAVTMAAEWKRIAGPVHKKILYTFTFPFFMLTYIPIALVALVKKASWKPIAHTISVDVEEMSQTGMK